MQNDAWVSFCERVSCDDHYLATCEPLADALSPAQAALRSERNGAALSTIAALEDRRGDVADDDSAVLQELQRLDAKLTALMDIVNRLVLPDSALPPRHFIRFNAVGAVLPADMLLPAAMADAAEPWLLRLHFDVCRSLPLELPGMVARRFDDGHVFLAFQSLGESVAASLERLVFRQHRRKVAVARQSVS